MEGLRLWWEWCSSLLPAASGEALEEGLRKASERCPKLYVDIRVDMKAWLDSGRIVYC